MPSLAANLLYVYHMIHTVSPKRVTFVADTVEITESSTGNIIAKGFANHASRAYEFSHFPPTSHPPTLLTRANNTRNLWHEIFGHLNFKYLEKLYNDKMVEALLLIQTSDGVCPSCLVGKHTKKIYEVGKETRVAATVDLIHSNVS